MSALKTKHKLFCVWKCRVGIEKSIWCYKSSTEKAETNQCWHILVFRIFLSVSWMICVCCFWFVPAVKPDPPERVTATPIRFNVRRLEVSWHSPATWPDIDNFPLKYFLRYRPLIREQWQHVSDAAVCVLIGRRTRWRNDQRWLRDKLTSTTAKTS